MKRGSKNECEACGVPGPTVADPRSETEMGGIGKNLCQTCLTRFGQYTVDEAVNGIRERQARPPRKAPEPKGHVDHYDVHFDQ